MNIVKSDRFKQQAITFAQDYKAKAGDDIALRFIDAIDVAIDFIATRPLACRVYHESKSHPQLQQYEFRKWPLKGFPHSVFFRIDGETIYLEIIYAHRMQTITRMENDFDAR